MQAKHQKKYQYFQKQSKTTRRYVLPYIQSQIGEKSIQRVLEIGCGEGGNLVPFLEQGMEAVGVDISPSRIELAKEFLIDYTQKVRLMAQDIYDVPPEDIGRFDVIIMRDVIEHIHDQQRFMAMAKQFLAPQGIFYLGFPPWYMPFGGHQQICHHRLLSKLPYFHLYPKSIYRGILRAFGENEVMVNNLLEIKETGISIERFERILKRTGYHIKQRQLYLINPNYETKFNLKPVKQLPIIDRILFFRNFYTTCAYYLVGVN